MKRIVVLILACMLLLSACGAQPKPEPTPEPTPEPVAGVDYAPDTGTADRSNLQYLSSIESSRKGDWSAFWIWTKGCSDDSYMMFRKTFTLDADPGEVTALISAVDKYVFWVNGELTVLDGSLKRGPTPYDSYYDEVPITSLKAGENTLAVLVAFNGRDGDGSIVPVLKNADGDEENQAGFLFEMQAGTELIVSDNSWKAMRSPAYKNRVTAGADYPNYKQSSMLAERNVYYNAQDELNGWTQPGFDDSTWEAAAYIAKPGQLPFGELYAAGTKPVKFEEPADFSNAADYLGKALSEDTTLELDLPGNRQFTWLISLEAPAGKKLTVYTDTYTDTDDIPNFKDTYITREGSQTYENYPWRSGSKLIIETEAGVTFTSLQYRLSGYNGEQAGNFSSSEVLLDQLWRESLNTVAICMRDTFMDCPDRERGPYMGDASNQIDAVLYSYGEGGLDIIRKAILNCVAWTTTSNAIPSRAPSTKPQEIPNQSLIFMSSAYHYWLASGDRETMTAYYHAFINYLKLFETDDTGFVLYRDGSWQWNDWGKNIDAEMLQAGIYAYALKLTQQLASDLGIPEDEAFLTERMTAMQNGWRERFTQADGFRSAGSKYVDDRANAMLVLSGLAGEENYPQIIEVLANTYEASPFCEKYVLEALCLMDREDIAMQRILDRYAPMLTDEYDTLWEKFSEDRGTVNHGWTAAPLYILSRYVAGVQPTAPGYETYTVKPSEALDSYSCTVWTPRGNITVIKEGDTIKAEGPSNGTLILPSGETSGINS